jgi:hypothetical protein
MTDDIFDLAERRKLLTGIGTVALGGVATSLSRPYGACRCSGKREGRDSSIGLRVRCE